MEKDWIPVVADAVKIGLGALIGGGISIIGAWYGSYRKLRESEITDKRQQLKEIVSEISSVHQLFLHQSASIAALASVEREKTKGSKGLRDAIESHLAELGPDTEAALLKLHELEARLCLLGLESVAATSEQYRNALTGIPFFEEKAAGRSKEELCSEYEEVIMNERLRLLRELAAAYKAI